MSTNSLANMQKQNIVSLSQYGFQLNNNVNEINKLKRSRADFENEIYDTRYKDYIKSIHDRIIEIYKNSDDIKAKELSKKFKQYIDIIGENYNILSSVLEINIDLSKRIFVAYENKFACKENKNLAAEFAQASSRSLAKINQTKEAISFLIDRIFQNTTRIDKLKFYHTILIYIANQPDLVE